MQQRQGKLLLLPNLLDETSSLDASFPPSLAQAVAQMEGLIAESEKEARRYLFRFLSREQVAALSLRLLNEHTKASEIEELLCPLQEGQVWGLISDAGLPCIADPGSELVWQCHQRGIAVEALVGPSSIFLALQLSGFSGQSFCFHGYLPREEKELAEKIKRLEQNSREATQVWIEAPYRSAKMVEVLKRLLVPKMRLCVACNLMTEKQKVVSQFVSHFSFPIGKEPAVFLLAR